MAYTIGQCEALVSLADKSGRITFKQIKEKFPECRSIDLYDWIGDAFADKMSPTSTTPLILWEKRPDDYVWGYQFKPDDSFVLSIEGDNLRYHLDKERYQKLLALIAAICSAVSAAITIWTAFSSRT